MGLRQNYADVSVEVDNSPDLRKAPYYLASEGLSGSPTIIDVGADAYIVPIPNFTKTYDLLSIMRKSLPHAKSICVCGAGAAPYTLKDTCGEVHD